MIESTLKDWMCLLVLEMIVLVAIGYCNRYISKSQMRKIAEHGRCGKRGVCPVEPKVRINRLWYPILAITASAGSAFYFRVHFYANNAEIFRHQGIFLGVIEVFVVTAVFIAITVIFLFMPYVGEDKAVRGIAEQCFEQYGVIISIDE